MQQRAQSTHAFVAEKKFVEAEVQTDIDDFQQTQRRHPAILAGRRKTSPCGAAAQKRRTAG
jgi:hypothetical protein